MLPQQQQSLVALLQTADYSGLSDADAATKAATTLYSPRAGRITVTTLAGADVWGFGKTAAAMAAFQAVVSGGGANGAQAAALLAVLTGPGFDASDPQAATLAPTFVAMSGGVLAASDGLIAMGVPFLPAGFAPQTADVTTARQVLAAQQASFAKRQEIAAGYNAAVTLCDDYDTAASANPTTAVPPTAQQLQQAFAGQVVG